MARDARGNVLMAPVFTIPKGHISERADIIDEAQRRLETGQDVSDLIPRPLSVDKLGYIAVHETEQVVRSLE